MKEIHMIVVGLRRAAHTIHYSALPGSSPCFYPSCRICYSKLSCTITSERITTLQCPKCNASYSSDTAELRYKVDLVAVVWPSPDVHELPFLSTASNAIRLEPKQEAKLLYLTVFGACLDTLFGMSAKTLQSSISSSLSNTSINKPFVISECAESVSSTIESSPVSTQNILLDKWIQIMTALETVVQGMPIRASLPDKHFRKSNVSDTWRLILPASGSLTTGSIKPLLYESHPRVCDCIPWLKQDPITNSTSGNRLHGPNDSSIPDIDANKQKSTVSESIKDECSEPLYEWDLDPRLLENLVLTQVDSTAVSDPDLTCGDKQQPLVSTDSLPCSTKLGFSLAVHLADQLFTSVSATADEVLWQEQLSDNFDEPDSDAKILDVLEQSYSVQGNHTNSLNLSNPISNQLQPHRDCIVSTQDSFVEEKSQSNLLTQDMHVLTTPTLNSQSLQDTLLQCPLPTVENTQNVKLASLDHSAKLSEIELKMVQDVLCGLTLADFSDDEVEADILTGAPCTESSFKWSSDSLTKESIGGSLKGAQIHDEYSDLDDDVDEIVAVLTELGLERANPPTV
ncbi:hypothetical protein O5D80_008153 [Batrachochytrium dendrobatidis]|nr:hypothetical protein O5D80_008153 [Batrachochytrium dendrobatidis]